MSVRPAGFFSVLAVLLIASVAMEVGTLSGLWAIPVPAYHAIHLLLMAGLLTSMLLLYRGRRREGSPDSVVPLLFAAGLTFTGIGDFVNSALSPVRPIPDKLTWALLFFGLGYSCFVVGLVTGIGILARSRPPMPRWLWMALPVILAFNVVTWLQRIRDLVAPTPLLSYGSFVFNATLYVLLPWLAIRYLLLRRGRVDAVLVLGGTVLLAYSDLVLFDSWLVLPAGAAVPTALYAINWIVYFGGQCLMAVFPAALARAGDDTVDSAAYRTAVP